MYRINLSSNRSFIRFLVIFFPLLCLTLYRKNVSINDPKEKEFSKDCGNMIKAVFFPRCCNQLTMYQINNEEIVLSYSFGKKKLLKPKVL